jgi:hypothetical protein
MASPFPPLDQPLWDQAGQALNRRREQRLEVGSVLPVQLRQLPPSQSPGDWLKADILDISCGGLALLVSDANGLIEAADVLLDVSSHPDFGAVRLPGCVRWKQAAGGASTLWVLGIQFDRPLARLPRLITARG